MWSRIQLGDLGTWIASLGTVAAVVFALQQSKKAISKEKEKEVKEQAGQVSAWLLGEGPICGVALRNSSSTPVYQAVLSLVAYQGAGPRDGKESSFKQFIGMIPPGQTYTSIQGGGGAMHIRLGVELAFTDSNGNNWVREVNGRLRNIKNAAAKYYSTPQPISWELPTVDLPRAVKIDPAYVPMQFDLENMPSLRTLLGNRIAGKNKNT